MNFRCEAQIYSVAEREMRIGGGRFKGANGRSTGVLGYEVGGLGEDVWAGGP